MKKKFAALFCSIFLLLGNTVPAWAAETLVSLPKEHMVSIAGHPVSVFSWRMFMMTLLMGRSATTPAETALSPPPICGSMALRSSGTRRNAALPSRQNQILKIQSFQKLLPPIPHPMYPRQQI